MIKFNTQYLIAIVMVSFSVYQLTIPEYWEFALYFFAGLAFLVMGLIKNNLFPNHAKLMTTISWILIFIAGFLLMFLARTDP